MKNQKTEFVDINELLKAENIRKDEIEEQEITGEDVLNKLVGIETPPEIEEQEEAEIKVATPTAQVQIAYTDKLQDYISLGFLEDVAITVEEEGEEKQVFLSELTDVDEDTFKAIISQYKEAKDKELKEKYISRDGLDERTEKYIELKKAGGDISNLIETEVQYVNPISKFDLDNEAHQEALVRQMLEGQGLRPKVIDAQIQEFKEDMSLDLEAKKIAKDVNDKFDAYVETKKQEQLDAIAADKEQQKEFRKNIGAELKNLVADENIAKLILDNTTKRGEYGLTNTDQLFFEAQKDPKVFAEIALFLNNREAFLKSVGAKAALKDKKETIKTLFSINPSVVKTIKKDTAPKTEGDEVFEKLTAKFNQ